MGKAKDLSTWKEALESHCMVLCRLSLSDLDTRPKILERPESLDITEKSFLYRMRRQ